VIGLAPKFCSVLSQVTQAVKGPLCVSHSQETPHSRQSAGFRFATLEHVSRGLGSFPVHAKIRSGSSNEFETLVRHPKLPRKITAVLRADCLGSLRLRLAGLPAQEAEQFGVDFFRVCPRDAVWAVLHDQQPRSFDELGGAQSRSRDG
jgi:hypothetical protein